MECFFFTLKSRSVSDGQVLAFSPSSFVEILPTTTESEPYTPATIFKATVTTTPYSNSALFENAPLNTEHATTLGDFPVILTPPPQALGDIPPSTSGGLSFTPFTDDCICYFNEYEMAQLSRHGRELKPSQKVQDMQCHTHLLSLRTAFKQCSRSSDVSESRRTRKIDVPRRTAESLVMKRAITASGYLCFLKIDLEFSIVEASEQVLEGFDIWPVGASSPLGHPADDERLALVEHLAVKGRLRIWHLKVHLVHLTLMAHLAQRNASGTSGADGASGTSGAEKHIWRWMLHHHTDSVASRALHQVIMDVTSDRGLRKKGCIQTYKGHTRGISTVKFTPDGRWLLSGGLDNVVKVWDITAGKLLHEFKFHDGPIRSLDSHPLEFLLATGSADRTVKF
ncbi:hypothetical protein F2Q69_00063574 [Brassica cretica]|uniref:Anaphase-promoting complex subunit 4 WD40 domain-containing protein n=1 Tax=Brassica cretica TaxID=69181 RepID=A0A8S9RBY5_BRACR|nr:hypothetical protein F2Q69_00063574 [Brassica cretica]